MLSEEDYAYDAAGNLTDAPDSCFLYDVNNRLTTFKGQPVSYDMDGNMLSATLSAGAMSMTYDSANRLLSAGGHTYTYDAQDVRIRNLCDGYDTKYTYNTNGRMSQLLMKTTNGIVTKYVYGRGLIGEEKQGEGFKTYHFDFRGSTVAITDKNGKITDTFAYDTYGKLIARTGESFVIFGFNGRDGVMTDKNGLIYMRARYYSPELRRFVNADVVAGEISNAITLNRYAYANGNPVSNVDPFGLSSFSPWGKPNTHVVWKAYKGLNDIYERWFGPDGRAVMDRHWSHHKHPRANPNNPHDEDWDWSDPKHPRLDEENSRPSPDAPDSPPPEGEEEWNPNPEQPDDSSENNQPDNSSELVSEDESILEGVLVLVGSAVALGWLVGNDITGIGTADDIYVEPTIDSLVHGWGIIFG